jgi:xylose isomerase
VATQCQASAVTSVNDANADTSLLAADTARLGASLYNDSLAACYVLLNSGVASATNFTVKMSPGSYYEVPYGYSGAIRGYWEFDSTGAMRVTEYKGA